MKSLVLLSGPLSIGKSAVARQLNVEHGFQSIRTGAFLAELAQARGLVPGRTTLQNIGDALDAETDYLWIVDQVAQPLLLQNPETQLWLLDSVRKQRQVEHFRSNFQSDVYHVHLAAPEALLRERYRARLKGGGDYSGHIPYENAINHANEISARNLEAVADIVIEVSERAPEEIAKIIIEGLRGRANASGCAG